MSDRNGGKRRRIKVIALVDLFVHHYLHFLLEEVNLPTRNLKSMSYVFFSDRLNVDECINMLLKATAEGIGTDAIFGNIAFNY